MPRRTDLEALSNYLLEAKRAADQAGARPVRRDTLASLLDAARVLSEQGAARTLRPIGLIDHVACSGGTIISRAVHLAANVTVLSEVDPFSDIHHDKMVQRFTPSDVIRLTRNNAKTVADSTVADMFVGVVQPLYRDLGLEGRTLVVRGHAHSRFFTGDIFDRPTVADMLARIAPVRRVLTVRHPLESYISARKNGYLYFDPPSLPEYCRRYALFLDSCDDGPMFKYEDFVLNPAAVLAEMLIGLGIGGAAPDLDLLGAVRLTGDSGRSGDTISPRPAKSPPDDLRSAIKKSKHYARLCDRLDYPIEPV